MPQLAEDMMENALAERPTPVKASPPAPLSEGPVLRPGRNVWRIEHAPRAAIIADGANYFGALRRALIEARETIHIAGWDLDSRMKLVGPEGTADDGLPETLAAFLSALVARNPRLRVRLLLWDYSVLFAFERELTPIYSFLWSTPPQIELCLDDSLPLGASHHQKIVVIDDAMAFSGGLDLTRRRWDTSDHVPDDPRRIDPTGAAYAPFHDVQMAVDGAAASALGRLFRDRWKRAACERLPPPRRRVTTDRWPEGLAPDFRDIGIGISRTLPAFEAEPEVREVEALFFDMIDSAERQLYLENQFFTCERFTERLIARLRERPALEAIIVVPQGYRSWFEHQSMGAGRARVLQRLDASGVADRVRVVFPQVEGEGEGDAASAPIMVHSKVTIVDDRLLRIGSANLCNRSMGFDSECDLVIDADDADERAAVLAVRDRMLGEHLGLSAEEVGAAIERAGSLTALIDNAAPAKGRRLVPVPREGEADMLIGIDSLADPVEPIYEERPEEAARNPRKRWLVALGVAALVVVGLLIAWAYSPLSEPERIIAALDSIAHRPWAPAFMVGVFIVAGFLIFPVSVLIVATVALFGGWTGALIAGIGAMASALATYGIGRRLGSGLVRRFIGPRINRIRRRLTESGVLAVATVRMVPVAPFTVVNLVAGAAGVRFLDYTAGTALGLLPGLVVLTALGRQIVDVISQPSLGSVAMLAGFVVLWILVSLGLQMLVARMRGRA
ncbi:VTT domain-containing protein [Ancylobacter sp. WKF20]|uniref:VTT domain-containing protein n=1 Tax=Ancylobacter sp. WKF20 TaxID=3039801 RepID=UPI002434195C|nr:VTT domain-containing protein [Ancylobacter sp. WKF20]WGD29504.1 VTT domain-containing protein [Ancylobacter sp. WKF20]